MVGRGERILIDRIYQHFDRHGLIIDCQYGFVHGKSCLKNLYFEEITKRTDEGRIVDVVYMANCKIPYGSLVWEVGSQDELVKWIQDWLVERSQG